MNLSEIFKCNICLGPLGLPVALNCGHNLCYECFDRMKQYNILDCTMCKKRILVANANLDIAQIFDKVFKDDEEYKRKTKNGYHIDFLNRSESRTSQPIENGNHNYRLMTRISGHIASNGNGNLYLCHFNDDTTAYLNPPKIKMVESDKLILKRCQLELKRARCRRNRVRNKEEERKEEEKRKKNEKETRITGQ